MYCERCEEHYFGGSLCPACGGRLSRGVSSFSARGELRSRGQEIYLAGREGSRLRMSDEAGTGRPTPILLRICYKFLESVFACVLFSVALRVVIFLVKVIDSLMETGGDIKEGISFYADMQMAISWYECAVWALILFLVFKYRHGPE